MGKYNATILPKLMVLLLSQTFTLPLIFLFDYVIPGWVQYQHPWQIKRVTSAVKTIVESKQLRRKFLFLLNNNKAITLVFNHEYSSSYESRDYIIFLRPVVQTFEKNGSLPGASMMAGINGYPQPPSCHRLMLVIH
jgi:hypothetical protein